MGRRTIRGRSMAKRNRQRRRGEKRRAKCIMCNLKNVGGSIRGCLGFYSDYIGQRSRRQAVSRNSRLPIPGPQQVSEGETPPLARDKIGQWPGGPAGGAEGDFLMPIAARMAGAICDNGKTWQAAPIWAAAC